MQRAAWFEAPKGAHNCSVYFSRIWRWRWGGADYELRFARNAVGEDGHQRVANGKAARTGGHQSDRRGSERGVRPARRRIRQQEKRLLVREAQQLDQRIV